VAQHLPDELRCWQGGHPWPLAGQSQGGSAQALTQALQAGRVAEANSWSRAEAVDGGETVQTRHVWKQASSLLAFRLPGTLKPTNKDHLQAPNTPQI